MYEELPLRTNPHVLEKVSWNEYKDWACRVGMEEIMIIMSMVFKI